ncbi:MAG TPA: hypothetical protein VMY59_02390 [Candidatus Thermoplasmatota archaeon]|nr:hypothetical protein [Candidatus Thermoplasmatota archaeon]
MKLKRTLVLILLFISVGFLILLGQVGHAQQAIVSIKNVNVELVETREPIGNRLIHVYDIIVVLHNSGDAKSDNINVYFYDPEFNATTTPPITLTPANVSLNPDEEKIFSLSNWPTPLSGNIPINISFDPASPKILLTDDNHGSYVYTLSINGDTKTISTPGFEIAFLLVAIMIFVLGRKIKK